MKPEILFALRSYSSRDFNADVLSGALVAIIALPLSIALAIQSGATVQQGILTAITAGFFIAVLGGTRYQIGGPSASFVSLTLVYITTPSFGYQGVQLAIIGAGLLLIIAGICRAGKLISLIPFPIITGFTFAIGIMLIFSQFRDFLGLRIPAGTGSHFIEKTTAAFTYFFTLQPFTVFIGALALAILLGLHRITKKIPAAICAIIVTTLITALAGFLSNNRLSCATIGSTFGAVHPSVSLLNPSAFKAADYAAIAIASAQFAFIAAIEGLLSAAVSDSLSAQTHNPNQELVGIGAANIACGFLGGIPATGVLARTAANIRNGGQTPVAGMVHSLVLLLIFLVLMPLVNYVPMTTLAAILLVVSAGMANFRLVFELIKFNVRDSLLMITVCVLTLCADLVTGIIASVILAVLLRLPSLFRPAKLSEMTDTSPIAGNAKFLRDELIFCRADGSLTFLSVAAFCQSCRELFYFTEYLVIDMSQITCMDLTAMAKLVRFERQMLVHNKFMRFINEPAGIERQHRMGHTVVTGM